MPHECFLIRNDYGWKINYDLPNELSCSIFTNDFKMCVKDHEQKSLALVLGKYSWFNINIPLDTSLSR